MAVASNSSTLIQGIIGKRPSSDFRNGVFGVCFSSRGVRGGIKVGVRATMQVGLEGVGSSRRNNLGFDVASEGELREKGFLGMRKTKLVCTIGPACCSMENLEKLALSGMNVARLNMCHNTREWHQDVIRKIKRLNEEKGFCVSVMIDTEGSQIHVLDHGSPSSLKAEDGSIWMFTSQRFEGSRPFTVQTNFEGYWEDVQVGDKLVIDGGMASFEVIQKSFNELHCKCIDPGLLLPRAKWSFWRHGRLVKNNFEGSTLLPKDWADIDFGISEGVDFIALSFINNVDPIKDLKYYLSEKSPRSIKVVTKIERLEIIDHLEEVVEASDCIMVARGDLGVEVPLEQIPSLQENITRVCRQLNRPVIIASQLLESMIEYPTPTRAEVADVSEAVRQYADALMLSGESAIGAFGQKALSVLQMVSNRMELWSREENHQSALHQHQLGESLPERIAEQICNCSVEMANKLGVDAIFVYTKHGHMASLLSRNRPNAPIFAFTDKEDARMALNLQWGVTPLMVDELSEDMEGNVTKTIHLIRGKGLLEKGDTVLVVSDIITPTCESPNVKTSIQVKTIT